MSTKLVFFFSITCAVLLNSAYNIYTTPSDVTYFGPAYKNSCLQTSVDITVNRLTTSKNFLPRDYNYFGFCKADNSEPINVPIAQFIVGDRLRHSPMKIDFLQNKSCEVLCTKTYTDSEESLAELRTLKYGIDWSYLHTWTAGVAPVLVCYMSNNRKICFEDFAIGCHFNNATQSKKCTPITNGQNDASYLYNHIDLHITYFPTGTDMYKIKYIEVNLQSIKHESGNIKCLSEETKVPNHLEISEEVVRKNKKLDVIYTYGVNFHRLYSTDEAIPSFVPRDTYGEWWFIMNGWFLLFVLSVYIFNWLYKLKYGRGLCNNLMNCCKSEEELVKLRSEIQAYTIMGADILSPPRFKTLYAALVGSGLQILCVFVLCSVMLFMNLINAERGSLLAAAYFVYAFSGIGGSYFSGRLYKYFGGKDELNLIFTITLINSGIIMFTHMAANYVYFINVSSSALDGSNLIYINILIFLIPVTLAVLAGVIQGFNDQKIIHPGLKKNRFSFIPVEYPRWFLICPLICLGPCTTIVFQAVLIDNDAFWTYSPYFIKATTLISIALFILICAAYSAVTVSLCMNLEEYRWWWISFLNAGTSGVCTYIIFSMDYFMHDIDTDFPSAIIYFGFMTLWCYLFFVMSGSIGFLGTCWYIMKVKRNAEHRVFTETTNLMIKNGIRDNFRTPSSSLIFN